MLPGEVNLPETILTPESNIVNLLFDSLKKISDIQLKERFLRIIKELQLELFCELCNKLQCPRCRRNTLARKGWRRRVLKSSRGKINLVVLQTRCKRCNRTCRPLNDRIGLSFSTRFLNELVEKSICLGLQLSYARSAAIVKNLIGGEISPEGIRRKVSEKAASLSFDQPVNHETVMVDSTKVKSGSKRRGNSVHLAITAERGPEKAGRPTIIKKLLHLHVGDVAPLKEALKTKGVKRLVHDGGEGFSHAKFEVQRCRFHLIHQLKHYLWQDGVPFEKRSAYQDSLRKILYDKKNGEKHLKCLITQFETEGLTTSAGHLRGAKAETFASVKEQGFSFSTTSPLEREMRELNRRADNGARWSDKGVENVLKVLFHYRLNIRKLVNPQGIQDSG